MNCWQSTLALYFCFFLNSRQLPNRRHGKILWAVLLISTARPTSPKSDQTKEGGRSGVERTPRFGAESERFDRTKIQLSCKLSPKEFTGKCREWMEAAWWEERPIYQNTKGSSTERPHVSLHTQRVERWAWKKSILSVPCGGQFHSRRSEKKNDPPDRFFRADREKNKPRGPRRQDFEKKLVNGPENNNSYNLRKSYFDFDRSSLCVCIKLRLIINKIIKNN